MDMKRIIKRSSAFVGLIAVLSSIPAMAGNPDRAGAAGATQLLINPWARSAGWGLANSASIRGVEAMYGNVAGLAMVNKTEVLFTNCLLYTSPSPRDRTRSRMPSSA